MNASHKDIDLDTPSHERAEYRRGIVKKLMLSKGITNRNEIRRILISEYGFPDNLSRQQVYKDVENIAKLSQEDIEEFKLDITAIYRKIIRDQIDEIEKCSDPKERSQLRSTLSKLMKEQAQVINSMGLTLSGGDAVEAKEKKKSEKITSFSFS